MADIVLTLREKLTHTVDLSCLVPDQFAALSNMELGDLAVWSAAAPRQALRLGDLFDIRGERSSTLRIRGDCRLAEGIGKQMSGGRVEIEGNAGADCGAAMSGGGIRISGEAGDNLGGAVPGASRGMTGGEIVVSGSAGKGAGARMRRGLMFIGGAAGDLAGRGMIAGTLVLGGTAGAGVGQGVKRGSVIALGPVGPPQGFQYACTYHPPHVPLILSRLAKAWGVGVTATQVHGRFRRHSGDMAELGKGEFLEWGRS